MQHLAKSLALAVLSVCFAAVAADAHAKRGARSSSSSSSKPSNTASSKKHDEAAKKKQEEEAKDLEARKSHEREQARNGRGIHIDFGSRTRSQAQQQSAPASSSVAAARPGMVPAAAPQPVLNAAEPTPEDRKRSEELAALQKRFEQETAARKAEADAKRAQEEARQAALAEAERKQREEKMRLAQREAEKKRQQEELQRQCVIKPVMSDADIAKCRAAWTNS
jgi:colicin import membrane protein